MSTQGRLAHDLRMVFEGLMEGIFVGMPGEITEYDATTRLASVKPSILRQYKGKSTPTSIAPIQNVLIIQSRTAIAQVRLPVNVGDKCFLIFADRNISNFMQGDGSQKAPLDDRMHDVNDAFAFLGGWPPASDGKTDDDPTSLLVQYKDSSLKIKEDGEIQIGAKNKLLKDSARKGDSVQVTIPTGTFLVAATAGVPNPAPVIVTGEITSGSDTTKVSD